MSLPSQDPTSLAAHFIEPSRTHPESSSPSLISQMSHRANLVSFWEIRPGSRVLEIGCGQGDTTVVLADPVGDEGFVDAIDKGSLDYDSIYYFSTPSTLPLLLSALTSHTLQICIAECSLSPSITYPLASIPHVLAVVLNAHLYSKRLGDEEGSIKTALSVEQIKGVVLGVGREAGEGNQKEDGRWKLEREVLFEVGELRDAEWKVRDLLKGGGGRKERVLGALVASKGMGGVEGTDGGEGMKEGKKERKKENAVVELMFDAVKAASDAVGGVGNVRCMRAWIGVFVLNIK